MASDSAELVVSQLFICPIAHMKYTPVPGLAPPRETCPKCGKSLLFECVTCGERYVGDDVDSKFHDCGAKIPWAKPYANEAKKHGPVTWDYWEQMAHEQEGWKDPPNPIVAFLQRVIGKGLGRGVEDTIAAIVKWAILALIAVVAGYLGFTIVFQ